MRGSHWIMPRKVLRSGCFQKCRGVYSCLAAIDFVFTVFFVNVSNGMRPSMLTDNIEVIRVLTTLENLENPKISGNLLILENSGNLNILSEFITRVHNCQ